MNKVINNLNSFFYSHLFPSSNDEVFSSDDETTDSSEIDLLSNSSNDPKNSISALFRFFIPLNNIVYNNIVYDSDQRDGNPDDLRISIYDGELSGNLELEFNEDLEMSQDESDTQSIAEIDTHMTNSVLNITNPIHTTIPVIQWIFSNIPFGSNNVERTERDTIRS